MRASSLSVPLLALILSSAHAGGAQVLMSLNTATVVIENPAHTQQQRSLATLERKMQRRLEQGLVIEVDNKALERALRARIEQQLEQKEK